MKHSKKIFTKLLALTLVASISLWSCKKEETTNPTETLDQDVTNSSIETADEVDEQSDQIQSEVTELEQFAGDAINAARTHRTITFKKCATATISKDATAGTRTVIIDYGTGCSDSSAASNGVTISRTGKITIVYTGKWNEQNTVKTITFLNFETTVTRNGKTFTRTVNGTRKVTNLSTISFNNGALSGTPKFRYENNFTIKLPAIDDDRPEKTVAYKSDKTKTWTKGFGSRNPFDDVFTVTGTFSGVNRKGVTYSAEVLEAITMKTECWKSAIFMPAAGKVKYTTDRGDATVNYGDGTCDKKVSVEINGKTYEFDRSDK